MLGVHFILFGLKEGALCFLFIPMKPEALDSGQCSFIFKENNILLSICFVFSLNESDFLKCI